MANFKTHVSVAAALSGVLATGFLAARVAEPKDVWLYFAMGTVGGILPDIDADHSLSVVDDRRESVGFAAVDDVKLARHTRGSADAQMDQHHFLDGSDRDCQRDLAVRFIELHRRALFQDDVLDAPGELAPMRGATGQ